MDGRIKLVVFITLAFSVLLVFQLFWVIPYIQRQEVKAAKIHQEEITRHVARELDIDITRIKNRLMRTPRDSILAKSKALAGRLVTVNTILILVVLTTILLLTQQVMREQKKTEEQLGSSRQRLRNLSAYLFSAREDERTRIARKIHDELGQALTVLKMDVAWLSKRLPGDQELPAERMKSTFKLIDDTIESVKTISMELRPGILDHLGLQPAIEWQTEEFQKHTGIETQISVDKHTALSEECSTTMFRIFQELLTNIARHANASGVEATLEEKAGKLVLTVKDNGRGITEEEISNPMSFGLMQMRERVLHCGGEVEIKGIPGKGTTVTVSIPND